jgi:hypothetical protein
LLFHVKLLDQGWVIVRLGWHQFFILDGFHLSIFRFKFF